MTPAARLSAAIEVLADIEARRRPASDALKDWGLGHRFAGSGDRSAIAGLVYDVLRRRASAAHVMGEASPRALLLGGIRLARNWSVARFDDLCSGARFAPEPLTDAERAALEHPSLADAPPHVAGDYPEWLDAQLAEAFGEGRVEEAQALAQRAPVDLRVNTLKTTREKAAAELAHFGVTPTARAPLGLRIVIGEDARAPAVQAEPAFQKGWIEVQDEGSQLAAQLAAADPDMQVVDLCAGAGGKTLALAAAMDNRGQIFATDTDKRRLAPIFDRLTRAGVRNAQVLAPRGKDDEPLAKLAGRADLVVVDAPCTGSGTWRRNPDAKWRMRPNSLDDRLADQAAVLARAARLVKQGGRIAYITCSFLPAENDGQIERFLAGNPGFRLIPPARVAEDAGLADLAAFTSIRGQGLQLSPRRTGTDGFFVALLRRVE
ncbi:RsmB/NOP family class I SAM-dependent RNA methyltransferase [Alsobacter sp. SYSU M60028]|uniref:RsmB/NOP family class I SAM-dependent RNA methyltransferase n=1 Tax=Alsobacter ponti TaxID=2962936 RepID=A0ABT1LGN1_9HYPH|nr:RsmB/NOP family class I SAM-dependent RNA methyltransferase [Alsobacter ponti]MCP8940241.1 RsmB/NOP family class I SAM-dependent RNA methyltransferase [Alsobacter ponti]